MRRLLAACAATILLVCPAYSWSPEAMNKAIEATNFVVNGGCSGTLVSVTERLILTNFHCVEHAISSMETEVTDHRGWVRKVRERRLADIPVAQHGYDGFTRVSSMSYVSEIVADDRKRDLALLRLKTAPVAAYASPMLPDGGLIIRGERVYVVGNPAGNDATVVEGIVSNVNRTFEFPWTDSAKLPMIQFSGGIYGGNSGGALYNDSGQLIGVPAAGHTSANFIGLAVPVSIVKLFLREHCFASVFDAKADDKACRDKKIKNESKD